MHAQKRKAFAVLIDPDNVDENACKRIALLAQENNVDFIFVGGSLLTTDNLTQTVNICKANTTIPVVLFPANSLHIDNGADAILFLSLISGRNPEFLIGQHILAAPKLKRSNLQILPTGYILIDTGKPTTVTYISNTTPIPYEKDSVAACTALAGELLGLKLIYMDGGSGAEKPISKSMIKAVCDTIDVPLIVGGGINSVEKAKNALEAGADIIVVGNALEKSPELLKEIAFLTTNFV